MERLGKFLLLLIVTYPGPDHGLVSSTSCLPSRVGRGVVRQRTYGGSRVGRREIRTLGNERSGNWENEVSDLGGRGGKDPNHWRQEVVTGVVKFLQWSGHPRRY